MVGGIIIMVDEKLSSEEILKENSRMAKEFHIGVYVISEIEVKKIIKRAKEEEREKLNNWIEKWFEEKRKNNDLWRIDQDDLVTLFLDGLKKEFKL